MNHVKLTKKECKYMNIFSRDEDDVCINQVLVKYLYRCNEEERNLSARLASRNKNEWIMTKIKYD